MHAGDRRIEIRERPAATAARHSARRYFERRVAKVSQNLAARGTRPAQVKLLAATLRRSKPALRRRRGVALSRSAALSSRDMSAAPEQRRQRDDREREASARVKRPADSVAKCDRHTLTFLLVREHPLDAFDD